MYDVPNSLSWALVIATFQREHILARCLKLAAEQTRPPKEIAVVDASPNWEKTRDEVMTTVAARHPAIRWHYVPAEVRSITTQRNQGLKLVETEVVFLIDDDSLMYPDCAAKIMEIYEADTEGRISGILAVHEQVPPDDPNDNEALASRETSTQKNYGAFARFVRKLLDADNIFVPYDEDYPHHEAPATVRQFHTGVIRLMVGWGMTFRRSICLKEPFSEILRFYAAQEDTDMSYRASRHGPLMVAADARLCHVGSKGGRASSFVLAALRNLNPLVLHRLYSTDLKRSRRRQRMLVARQFLIFAAKDLSRCQWAMPNSRGALLALRMLDSIFDKSEEELKKWYPLFQKQLMDRESSPKKPSSSN